MYVDLLDEGDTAAETHAIHETFSAKRKTMVQGLRKLGVRFDLEPEGTFYCWGDLSQLPPSLRNGEAFFRAALEHKVITVPGLFFDVDPGKRRGRRHSRFHHHARFSFGPPAETIERALARFETMIAAAN